MLENGDSLDVDASIGRMEFNLHNVTTQANLFALQGPKPYMGNLNQIECIVGEWNKDKTEYGLRIFYASGNSAWIGNDAANNLLKYFKAIASSNHSENSENMQQALKQFHNK